MRFSSHFIEKIQESSDIVNLISRYTELTFKSGRHWGCCPFPDHKESVASFSIIPEKQFYYCFGCKRHGNVFTFLQEFEGMTFVEAVETLARQASIPLETDGSVFQTKKKQLLQINGMAKDFYFKTRISQGQDNGVKTYLTQRGLKEETLETFQVGYAPNHWDKLVNHLKKKKISEKEALELGLIKKRLSGSSGFYDVLRDRVVFPILSPLGDTLGFGGRVINNEDMPKYLNSSESEVFHKSRVLYGLHETARYIRYENKAILVEGYMDLLVLYQHGIKNVIATLGTALTSDHARLIKKYTDKVLVLFDGDKAGQEAARKSLPLLLENDLLPQGLCLPDGQDPDDFVRLRGKEKLCSLIDQAPELFYQILDQLFLGFKETAFEKIKIVEEVALTLLSIKRKSLFVIYFDELKERLKVKDSWLRMALQEVKKKKTIEISPPSVFEQKSRELEPSLKKFKISDAPREELTLLQLSLMNSELFESILSKGIYCLVKHQGIVDVFSWLLEKKQNHVQGGSETWHSLLTSYVDQPKLLLMDPDLMGRVEIQNTDKILQDCIKKLQWREQQEKMKVLQKQMVGGKLDSEKLEQIMNIQRDRLSISESFEK